MVDWDLLYRELKPDIEQLADPLFRASQRFVKERGEFLPHGAVLVANDDVRLVMAVPPGEDRPVSAIEVLPLLHEALRVSARQDSLRAVAVCEDVRITVEGEKQTAAIKVLIEHRRGLCVALYMPFRRRMLAGYRFGQMFAKSADPEVSPWQLSDAGRLAVDGAMKSCVRRG